MDVAIVTLSGAAVPFDACRHDRGERFGRELRRKPQGPKSPFLATSGRKANCKLRRLNPQQRKYDTLTSALNRTTDARWQALDSRL